MPLLAAPAVGLTYGSAAPLRPPWSDRAATTAPSIQPSDARPALGVADAGRERSRRAPWWGWGGLAVCSLLGLTSGVGGALGFAGLFAFVVALVALVRGRVGWAHLPGRASGAAALVGAIAAVLLGSALSPATTPVSAPLAVQTSVAPPAHTSEPTPTESSESPATSEAPTPSPSTPADPVEAAIQAAQPGSALALVGTLTVQGRGPMTGYSRAEFGAAWTDTDRNGCDQRNDTLRRDLRAVTLKAGTNGCAVMTGTLQDPYTATTLSYSRTAGTSPIQIDHVVALADAWVKGAARWPSSERTAFANDTLNLVAVSASANESKGSGDTATWLPPATGYRCAYVARQVAVKARYRLAVTPAERAAMVRVLTTCAETPPPSVAVARLGGFPVYTAPSPTPTAKAAPKPAPQPAPKPAPKPAPQPASPSPVQGVHPGAFCSPEGAFGYTTKGTLMQCTFKAGDIRARWRSA